VAETLETTRRKSGAARKRGPGRPSLSNEELLDTALDLFLENGFDGTSIDAICAAAGMAKRTVYARYGDKTSLFRAALSRAIGEWILPVERLREAECDDLEQTLLALGKLLLTNILSPAGQRLMRLTNAESVRMPDIGAANVREGTEPTLAYLAELFARRVPDCDAQAAGTAFINLVVGGPASMASWGAVMEESEIERHIAFSVHLFLHGLLDKSDGAVDGAKMGEALALLDKARDVLRR
jgi:AcrR family transcriptional regulator